MKSQDQFRLVQTRANEMIQLLADLADAMDAAREALRGVVKVIEKKIEESRA